MTPMIDVVFLMIIFFICIEFKVLESKLDAFLPTVKGSQNTVVEPEEQLSIKIHVEAKGTRDFSDYGGEGINENTGRPNRFALKGHKVRWEVGPKPLSTIEQVKAEQIRHEERAAERRQKARSAQPRDAASKNAKGRNESPVIRRTGE